jgi:hypothetical protein
MDILEKAEHHGYQAVSDIVPRGYSEADTFINDMIVLHQAGYVYRISYAFDNMDDWESANRPYIEAIQQLIEEQVVLKPWTVCHYPTGIYGRTTVTVLLFTSYKDFVYFKMMIV